MKREIIDCKLEDAARIEGLEKKCFSHPWTLVNIEEDMTHDFSYFKILILDGQDIGYVNYWIIDGAMELNRICIDPAFRQQDHAEFIMDDLLYLCKIQDLERIILEVAADNKPALALYDKYDFYDVHLRENYYDNKVDALIKVRMTDEL